MKSELNNLIELQKDDTRIRQLNKTIDTSEERRANLEEEFEKHVSFMRDIQKDRDEANAKRVELEVQIREAKTDMERANRNLKTARDQKQYEAAMRELASLNKQISKFETKVLENMEVSEKAENILEERADEVNDLESNWKKKIQDFDKELINSKAELKQLTNKREVILANISSGLVAIYDRLVKKSRNGMGVVKVKDNACSACFMYLRKQMVVDLKTTNKIVTCESCARILYVDDEDHAEKTAG